jgi:hypothetical protein
MAANDIRAGSAFVEIYAHDNKLTLALKKASMKLEAFSKKCYAVAQKSALHLAVIPTSIAKSFSIRVFLGIFLEHREYLLLLLSS